MRLLRQGHFAERAAQLSPSLISTILCISKNPFYRALEQLYALGALDSEGNLTKPLGDNLSRLPLEPTLGKVLLTAAATDCAQQALAVVAMASTDAVFLTSR